MLKSHDISDLAGNVLPEEQLQNKDHPYQFGPFQLDLMNERILRDGQPVRWRSRRRYQLLKALLEADGNVVTFDQLVDLVWGGRDVQLHTITQTANDLKRRLAEFGDCVQNQHGVGYYFKPLPEPDRRREPVSLDLDTRTAFHLAEQERHRRTSNSLRRATQHYRTTLSRYPRFVPALIGLADCLTLLGHAGFPVFLPRQILPEARALVERSLELAEDNETLAAAHCALAKLQLMFDWEFDSSEENFKVALKLDPNQPAVHHGLAHLYLITYRWDHAFQAILSARHLAPSSPMIHGTQGWLRYFAGQYGQAIEHCRTTVALHPEFPAGYVMLAQAVQACNQHPEALRLFRAALILEPSPVPVSGIGHLMASKGANRWPRLISKLDESKSQGWAVSAYHYALIYAGAGDFDQTLRCLESAYEERFDWLIHLCVDPRWNSVRDLPKFQELVKRVGLARYEATTTCLGS